MLIQAHIISQKMAENARLRQQQRMTNQRRELHARKTRGRSLLRRDRARVREWVEVTLISRLVSISLMLTLADICIYSNVRTIMLSLLQGQLQSGLRARTLRPRLRECVSKRKSICSELETLRLRVKQLRILIKDHDSGDGESSETHVLALAEAVQRTNDLEDQREAVAAEMAGLQVNLDVGIPIQL